MAWAREEFGNADLGDARRERRLVQLAAGALNRPGGAIAKTYEKSADREAAFRFCENEAIAVEAIGNSVYEAAARRCAKHRVVIVSADLVSLCLRDPSGRRGFGPVGSHHRMTTGVQVMNALAVERDGGTIGLLDQQWWVRSFERIHQRKRNSKSDKRPPEVRETYAWVRTLRASEARLREHAPGCTPWFQLDRGADCRWVLELARDERLLVTVRVKVDRRLQFPDGRGGYLYETIEQQPVSGYYYVDVPARPHQQARQARMAVRFLSTPLALPVSKRHRRAVWVNVVCVEEVGAPEGQSPIKWMLITTRKVETLEDALQVVSAYTLRWRVEEFHKTWKSGACDIETSQLQALDHFLRWATIMAAVAARIERLKYLSRSEPERPATDEFSRDEIDALLLLRQAHGYIEYESGSGRTPTIGEVTSWIADLGGHMGSKKTRPPGAIVLRRGLERLESALETIKLFRRVDRAKSG